MKKKKGIVLGLEKLGFLDELREVFYQNTGLIISFHHQKVGDYDFYPKFERNEYCSLLQSTPSGLKKCIESDSNALDKAKKDKKYCLYKCHAGLTNAAIHLEYKGMEIGSIFTGQILTTPPTEEQFNKIYRYVNNFGIPEKQLKKAFFSTKIVDEHKLIFGIKLLEVMSNYIISVEDEVFLQKEVLQKDKEILEYKNEKIELENELQKLRISILEYNKDTAQLNHDGNTIMDKNSHSIQNAQNFIKDNYFKNIMLNDVAESVYLSPNYFSTVFKEVSGYSFSFYLRKTRIKAAKRMLIETDLPIKEIVFAVGFDDYNYFNRIFKKAEGIPPAKFRLSNQNHKQLVVE